MKRWGLIFSLAFTLSIAAFASPGINHYTCSSRSGASFSLNLSGFTGQPSLSFSYGDVEVNLRGSDIQFGYHQDQGLPVFVSLNEGNYSSMSVFLPHKKHLFQPSYDFRTELILKKRYSGSEVVIPLICTAMSVVY